MKKLMYLGIISIFGLFSSCLIPTIHPLYTEDVLITHPLLEGKWENIREEGEEWYFEEKEDHYYLTQGAEHQAFFEIHLVELGDKLFFDFKPTDIEQAWENSLFKTVEGPVKADIELNELMGALLLPIHTFSKVEIRRDEVKIWFFDPEWLEKLFEERKIRISHEKIEDMYLITADSKELQKFVSKYADLEEAYVEFNDPIVLKRIKS